MPAGPDWLREIKYDGYRMMLNREQDHVRLISRRNHDWAQHFSALRGSCEMIQIEVTRIIPVPKPRQWRDEYIFESGDAVWTLVLHDSFEWLYGAVGWQAKLLRNDSDVLTAHQILKSLVTGKGFYFPRNYVPWCHK